MESHRLQLGVEMNVEGRPTGATFVAFEHLRNASVVQLTSNFQSLLSSSLFCFSASDQLHAGFGGRSDLAGVIT